MVLSTDWKEYGVTPDIKGSIWFSPGTLTTPPLCSMPHKAGFARLIGSLSHDVSSQDPLYSFPLQPCGSVLLGYEESRAYLCSKAAYNTMDSLPGSLLCPGPGLFILLLVLGSVVAPRGQGPLCQALYKHVIDYHCPRSFLFV